MYCSTVCQKEDWKRRHKEICKSLSVGEGAMQMRHPVRMLQHCIALTGAFEGSEHRLDDNKKRFFKLFKESMLEGSQAAALEMTEIAARETQLKQKELLFHSLFLLIHTESEKLL
jgi:hypothetical protein